MPAAAQCVLRKERNFRQGNVVPPIVVSGFPQEIRGVVETVLSRGKVVIENGEYKGKAGDGQFLKRGTCVAM